MPRMANPADARRRRAASAAALPAHIQPMLATLSDLPVDTDAYGFEYKWDGVRALLYWDGVDLRLESRNLLDITHRYPELWPIEKALRRGPVILDGEIVALDAEGRPSFSLLQRRMHVAQVGYLPHQVPIILMLFDVLHHDGRSTMALPYTERRAILESLKLSGANWQTPPWYPGEGRALLSAATQTGLEGIIAKRLASTYEPGRRSRDWLKIKVIQRQEFVIGGWTPGEGANTGCIGALLLGYYDPPASGRGPGVLKYAGSVGTGFSAEDHRRLLPELRKLRRDTSPFSTRVPKKEALFVEPELVAEIEYREWTHDGHLRHPSYKGLRTDKPAEQVVREG